MEGAPHVAGDDAPGVAGDDVPSVAGDDVPGVGGDDVPRVAYDAVPTLKDSPPPANVSPKTHHVMSEEIKYTLNVQSVDNPLTKEEGDTHFVLVQNGTADFDRVISEMMSVNPGMERETVEAIVKLEHRTIQRLTLSGMRVSNGLFSAVASPKGRGGNTWDPAVNTLNITIAQGTEWREAIRATNVNVLGPKAEVMYISGTLDAATRADTGEATPGRPFTVKGNYLKVVGDDPSVGIYLVDEDGTETKITEDYWSVNEPQKLSFVIPADMADGTYTLRVVSQFSRGNQLRKTPHAAERTIYIGTAPSTGGSTGGGTGGGGEDGNEGSFG